MSVHITFLVGTGSVTGSKYLVSHDGHAGHILGAASILLEAGDRRLLFSGDLDRPDGLIVNPPQSAPQAGTVLIRSTDRNPTHPTEDVWAEWGPALHKLAQRGVVAVIPVFAIGPAQATLHAIQRVKLQGHVWC